jgi:hypothetical protein
MTQRRTPLDAEERALAAALPRPHGRSEPDAVLDARILAVAHAAAITPDGRTRPRRRRWMLPVSAAASVALAVGIAWQLRPLPAPPPAPRQAMSAPVPMQVEQPATVQPPPPPLAAPTATTPVAAPRRAAAPNMESADAAAPQAQTDAPSALAAPPPPPPPPAAPAVAATSTPPAVMAPEAMQREQAPQAAAAKARSGERAAQDSITVTGTRIRNEAEMAADAAWPEDPEDVPPATADSPEVREAWLRRIGDLQREGRTQEARDSLAEFRRRYPDAPLPPELRALLP